MKSPAAIVGIYETPVGDCGGMSGLELQAIAVKGALRDAGLSFGDCDALFIHDAFTVTTLLTIEGVGLCPLGEGSQYAIEGNLDLGGPCPVNVNGGFLSQGHTGGILHFTDSVRQLRGDAEKHQVRDAKIVAVAGAGGLLGECGMMILGTERA